MARIAQPDGLATGVLDVGDDQDLGVIGQLEVLQHMDLQRAEAAAEIDVLARGDALVAEHQHVVRKVRAVDAVEVLRAEGPRQIEAHHLGAQRACGAGHRADIEGLRRGIIVQGDGRRGNRVVGQNCRHGEPPLNGPGGGPLGCHFIQHTSKPERMIYALLTTKSSIDTAPPTTCPALAPVTKRTPDLGILGACALSCKR